MPGESEMDQSSLLGGGRHDSQGDAVTSFAQLMEIQRAQSWWNRYSMEAAHQREFDQLAYLTTLLDRCSIKMQEAPPWQKIKILNDLEEIFNDVPGHPQVLMAMLGRDLESVLNPAPSTSDMKSLARDMTDFAMKPLKDSGLPEYRGLPEFNASQWGMAEHNPTAPYAEVWRPYMTKHKEAFDKIVWDWLCSLRAKYDKYPVLHMFVVGLLIIVGGRCGSRGSVAFLQSVHLRSWEQYIDSKKAIAWASVGWIIEHLIADGRASPAAFNPEVGIPFQKIGTTVMSKFTFDVIQLRSLMETQQKELANVKTKILASSLTAALAVMQALIRYSGEHVLQ